MARGCLNGRHKCGFHINKELDGVFCIVFWISTENLNFLDYDGISSTNKYVYDALCQYVAEKIGNELVFCSIGVETYLNYCDRIYDVIQSSKNVNEWIFPKGILNYIEGYDKKIYGNCKVFFLGSD